MTTAQQRTGDAVAVLETDPTGHRLHYLAHLVRALGARRCTVLTNEHALRSEEYGLLANAITGRTVLLPDEPASPDELLRAAVAGALDSGARRLIVLDGDRYLLALLRLLLRRPWTSVEIRLLLLRTTAVIGPERLRPATLVKPVLAQIVRLFPQVRLLFLTDALGVVTRRQGYPGLSPVKDPVLRTGSEQHQRPPWLPAAAPDRPLIGLFGVISARKNLPTLIGALTRLPAAILVVAGQVEPDVRAVMDGDPHARALAAAGRLVVEDRLLEPAELAAGLAMVDMVAVLHDNDSPSGILAEACVRGTPALVPQGGWLAEVVDTTGIGVSTPVTPVGVADGVRRLHADRGRYVEATARQSARIDVSDFTERLLGP